MTNNKIDNVFSHKLQCTNVLKFQIPIKSDKKINRNANTHEATICKDVGHPNCPNRQLYH